MNTNGIPQSAIEATMHLATTETGIRITSSGLGFTCSIEFDPDQVGPSALFAIVEAFPDMVHDAVHELIESTKEDT
jgi:hypothetical protein